MKTKILSLLLILLFVYGELHSQYSTTGTDFWLSFHENFGPADPILYITSGQGSSGTVTVPGIGWSHNFNVGANQSVKIELPQAVIITQNNQVLNMGIKVTATSPVAVYAANERSASSDATLVFPIPRLGDNYRVNAYTPLNASNPSQFVVVGVENNTTIEIVPSANIVGGANAGTPFNVTLNEGQVYFVKSAGDLSGTIVRAVNLGECNHFAVFAGNKCANVPTCTFCDHLYEQMIPIKAWGTQYITTPLLTRNGDQYRIMALENNTVVNINNGPNINLNAGQFHEEYLIPASYIVADKPVSVAQYARGTSCDGANADPFMIMLSPVEQFIDYIVFHAFQTGYIQNFYTNIVSKTQHTNLVLFDGNPVANWNTVPANPDYSFARMNLTAGTYTIQSPEGVLAIAYGFGNVQSYGYLAGANIEPLDVSFDVIVGLDSIPYNEFQDSLGCEQSINGIQFYTDVEGITDVHWDLGDGTIVQGNYVDHVYQNAGIFTVTMYFMRIESCVLDSIWTTVHVTDNLPPFDFINDTIICNGAPFWIHMDVPDVFYEWHDGSTGSSMLVNQSGTYALTVSDNQGCSASVSAEVLFVDLAVNMNIQNITCAGLSDGSMTANPQGGSPPYSYSWGTVPSQTTQTIQNLAPGTFYVTVQEANGCFAAGHGTVIDPENFYANVNITQNISCFGEADGVLTVSGHGGTPPYTYVWDANAGGQTTAIASGLAAGTYFVTITDSYNCVLEHSVTLTNPPQIYATGQVTSNFGNFNISCNNANDGTAIAIPTGGSPPYYYQWSSNAGNQTSQIATGLGAGEFYATVSDMYGCEATIQVSLNEPPAIIISETLTKPPCFGETGSAQINASGGIPPFTIIWENNYTNFYINNVPTNIDFEYTVTDANNCSYNGSIYVTEPAPLSIEAIVTDVSCRGFGDGVIDLIITGSTPPYYVQWNTGSQDFTLSGIDAGSYSVSVTDKNQCEGDNSFVVIEPAEHLKMEYELVHVKCYGDNNGEIQISASGGTAPYAFFVNAFDYIQPGSSHKELFSGQYNLKVVDKNSCETSYTVMITQPDPLELSVFTERPSCRGNNDGYIEFSASGGVIPYKFSFNDNRTNRVIFQGLTQGNYTIEVTDAHECVNSHDIIYLKDMPFDCITIPNAFTPNGSGINDEWIIENIEMFPDATIEVFNRWGQNIWIGRGNQDPWDGKYKGNNVPTGTYLYTIDLRNGMKPYSGTVTVIH